VGAAVVGDSSVYDDVVAGAPLVAVAAARGISYLDAQHAYLDEAARRREHAVSEREHDRALELARLDRLLLALKGAIDKGDVGAITEGRRLSESRRKLLGLDAPVKVAPTDPSGEQPIEVTLRITDGVLTREGE
jgi:hypothetical protein